MAQKTESSPRWGSTTKLLIGLVIVGIAAFLLYRFANLLTPLLIIFILIYLLHPLTSMLSRGLHLSWKISVNIIYLFIIIILGGLITWGGLGLVQQVQSLIVSVQDIVANLPKYVSDITERIYQFGPFKLDLHTLNLDLNTISQQLLSFVEPLLGRTGNLVGALASGAAEVAGLTFFILLVSYFVMIESSGIRKDLFAIDLPGYEEDIRRLGNELSRIWNAFLRGQIIIFGLAVSIYSILLPAFGVSYALGLALMAGLAKFLPYIGPAITWIVMALVTFFQPFKPFGMSPLLYTGVVVGVTLLVDQTIDSFVAPRIMARALKVHPAAVLVAALVAANLIGLLGVVIAAPFLATITLLGRYTMRKMLDMDPWPEAEAESPQPVSSALIESVKQFFLSKFRRNDEKEQMKPKENSNEQQPQRTKNRNNRRDR